MMSELKDRFRELRKSTRLSQTDFAEKLGCGRGVIKGIEEGKTDISSAFADLICRIYGCDRIWLETGEGEMFQTPTRDEQITDFVGKTLFGDDDNDFAKQLLSILAALDDNGWKTLKAAAEVLKKAEDDAKNQPGE